MNKMQKLMKKNNKGFSLVELIVVVLIIGVLAVAIAPQVTKWVGTARTNQEKNEEATVLSGVQVALAEAQSEANSDVSDGDTVTISPATVSCIGSDDLEDALQEVFSDHKKLKRNYSLQVTGGAIEVTQITTP